MDEMKDHVLLVQECEPGGLECLALFDEGRHTRITPISEKMMLLGFYEGRIYFSRQVDENGIPYKQEIVRTQSEAQGLEIIGVRPPHFGITDLFLDDDKLHDVMVQNCTTMVWQTHENKLARIEVYDGAHPPVALLKDKEVYMMGSQQITVKGKVYYDIGGRDEFTALAHGNRSIFAATKDDRVFEVLSRSYVMTLPIPAINNQNFVCKLVIAGASLYFMTNDDHVTINYTELSPKYPRVKYYRLPAGHTVKNFIAIPRIVKATQELWEKGLS